MSEQSSSVNPEDRYVPNTPQITVNINNRYALTKPTGFYSRLETVSVANVLLRLEKAGCDILAIAFNGNVLDVTVVAYEEDWLDQFANVDD